MSWPVLFENGAVFVHRTGNSEAEPGAETVPSKLIERATDPADAIQYFESDLVALVYFK